MTPTEREVLQLTLEGMGDTEIAKTLGIAKGTVGSIKRKQEFKDERARLQTEMEKVGEETQSKALAEAQEVLIRGTVDAAHEIVKLSKGAESEKVRLSASQDILDRAMPKAKGDKASSPAGSLVMDAEGLKALAGVLRESMEIKRVPAAVIQPANPPA